MALQVFLSSALRKFISDYEPSKGIRVEKATGMTVGDLCKQLKIPEEKVKVIMINGRGAGFNKALNGDERVALFPPVGGG
jgi:molybdopterin synthase sulfur carrier subunit